MDNPESAITAFPDDVLSPATRRALAYALATMTDQWLDDATIWMTDALPPRYADRVQDVSRRFIVTLAIVGHKLSRSHWEAPECRAEELVLNALLQEAKGVLAEWQDGSLPPHWALEDASEEELHDLYDYAFDDLDFELLWRPETDGIDQDPDFAYLGIGSLRIEDWFEPFSDGRIDAFRAQRNWPRGVN